MKKLKLLAPMLGALATIGTAVPLVACTGSNDSSKPTVTVVNRNADTEHFVQVHCNQTETSLDSRTSLIISWNGMEGYGYYSDGITVEINGKIYFQQSDTIAEGFIFNGYVAGGNGVKITIPAEIVKGDIVVNLFLKLAEYDTIVPMETYINQGVIFDDGSDTPYDVVSSNKNGKTDDPYYIDVASGECVEFSIDLNVYEAGRAAESEKSLAEAGDLYFIASYFISGWGNNIISLDSRYLGNLYLGNIPLSYENDEGIITIHEPEKGWAEYKDHSTGQYPTITGWYIFNYPYENVLLNVGQESEHAPTP